MKTVNISTTHGSYPIYVGTNTLSKLLHFTKKATQTIVITDEIVYQLHYQTLKPYLPENTLTYIITPGENSKSFQTYYDIQTFLIKYCIDRKALILAFGGGVVGDLAGFVASTYMRGIDFIQIPTTLLAHDSAIGGKVAINHELGKNLIGAFYPPKAVIYELPFLKTLAEKERRSGLGEMIKHGFIADSELLHQLMNVRTLNDLQDESFEALLIQSLMVKKQIVEMDEYEKGCRAFLNFGHTFGHAVELAEKELSHGEAVAFGMIFSLYLSWQKFNVQSNLFEYIDFLKQLHFPIVLKEEHLDRYIELMQHDKKNERNLIRFVLLEEVEKPILVSFEADEIKELLQQFLEMMTKEVIECH